SGRTRRAARQPQHPHPGGVPGAEEAPGHPPWRALLPPGRPQRGLPAPPALLVVERGPLADGRRLLAIHNVSDQRQPLAVAALAAGEWFDLLENGPWAPVESLAPYRTLWLVQTP